MFILLIGLFIKLQIGTLIPNPIVFIIKLFIAKFIRILNFNSIGVLNAGIKGLK